MQMSNGNASVYLGTVGLGTSLGRPGSIGQAVAVSGGTRSGSQVVFVAQEGITTILN